MRFNHNHHFLISNNCYVDISLPKKLSRFVCFIVKHLLTPWLKCKSFERRYAPVSLHNTIFPEPFNVDHLRYRSDHRAKPVRLSSTILKQLFKVVEILITGLDNKLVSLFLIQIDECLIKNIHNCASPRYFKSHLQSSHIDNDIV